MATMTHEFYANRWDKANIPVSLRGMMFDNYDHPSISGRRALEKAREFVAEFDEHYISKARKERGLMDSDRGKVGKGLMFYGRNGTRKTTLACMIATEVQYLSPSYYTYYIRFSDWKRALTDTFDKERTERTDEAHKILRLTELAHLLILDDIGQEHRTNSGFTESQLHELLRIRYEAARPTIVTTNIDEESFKRIYGDSFESFRHDAFDTYPIIGKDLRKKQDARV